MKVKSYTLVLKGLMENEDRIIRSITVEGGGIIRKILLQENPPKFIEVKGRTISTNDI